MITLDFHCHGLIDYIFHYVSKIWNYNSLDRIAFGIIIICHCFLMMINGVFIYFNQLCRGGCVFTRVFCWLVGL